MTTNPIAAEIDAMVEFEPYDGPLPLPIIAVDPGDTLWRVVSGAAWPRYKAGDILLKDQDGDIRDIVQGKYSTEQLARRTRDRGEA